MGFEDQIDKYRGPDKAAAGGDDGARLAALQERVAKLELWNTFFKGALIVALGGIVLVIAGGVAYVRWEVRGTTVAVAPPPAPAKPIPLPTPVQTDFPTVRASSFVLVNCKGDPVGIWNVKDGDEFGEPQLLMQTSKGFCVSRLTDTHLELTAPLGNSTLGATEIKMEWKGTNLATTIIRGREIEMDRPGIGSCDIGAVGLDFYGVTGIDGPQDTREGSTFDLGGMYVHKGSRHIEHRLP